ncbi:MAG: glycerol-3-phosphate 1-O-acyltransferase PlsY [Nitrospinaceae bacterium]|nr:glycerol-3-phosphate 1-O-acyltransferase PlsY [Nitrospinaceae bacterium]NIR54109.1 glycerol-3-phosphate 1-O-acyltransferase PlsY [Nitrospinaceae bacterium]NIS84529.1 glycerol-3-phosphate 1-O-acyltransferase PlsY [Nitrospinaceae bacterium]NIT81321.1 glycerol-3-phosphate 1-O-acyltransferase PlsY [Nitrospinaceae bacterium]NIU43610.1 glycerol-3-phosphate 1-O-acyltransferase PlsY [Nitrospinaceae bacterium]
MILDTLFLGIVAYLLGSIPFGVLLARMQNIDLRAHGSGNIGATNAARILGKKIGLFTLLGDVAKGFLAVYLAHRILGSPLETAFAGLAAFLGHLYSIFLRFQGGKGVATALGIFLFLMPAATLSAAVVFAIALAASQHVSVGSILASLFLPLFGILYDSHPAALSVSVLVALLIFHKHRENLQRILTGEEAPFLKK